MNRFSQTSQYNFFFEHIMNSNNQTYANYSYLYYNQPYGNYPQQQDSSLIDSNNHEEL